MLVNIHHDSRAEHLRLLVAGVAFIAVNALLISFSIALYSKAFTDVTTITVKADRAGLQLNKFGDVRLNGALVGQVRSVTQDGREASIEIALEPEAARSVPENISVEILPTTLFGQKFVSLVRPPQPSTEPIAEGAVIPSDRVRTNVELSQVLANLFPLLRAVRPADLNATLNALATALAGRGERLGVTMDKLQSYLGAISDDLPTLRKNLVLLADVAETYDLAAPDLLAALRDATVTSRTISSHREQLAAFVGELTGLARTSTRVLSDNEVAIIRVTDLSEPLVRLLATYSPGLPCLLRGLDAYEERLAAVFAGGVVKQYIELNTPQYQAYGPQDRPVYGEIGHGPWCLGLPNPPVPAPGAALDDGSDIDSNPPTSTLPGGLRLDLGALASGFAGTDGDRALVNAILASRTGRPVDSYGSLPSLLYGPVVREGVSQ